MDHDIDVYHLVRLDGDGGACRHHLLIKSRRRDDGRRATPPDDQAVVAARGERDRGIALYQQQTLARECPNRHVAALAGEFAGYPEGTPFYGEHGGIDVDIWVAETRFGKPWIVFGMAASEAEFWEHLAEDEDASLLGPRRPARLIRAHFVMESDYRDAGKA